MRLSSLIISVFILAFCFFNATQAAKVEISFNETNISGTIDGQPITIESISKETDAFATELGWYKAERQLSEDEWFESERIQMAVYGWSDLYVNALGDEVRVIWAQRYGMYYVDHIFGVDSDQNETAAELADRINQTIAIIHNETYQPFRYQLLRTEDYGFGNYAVVMVRYMIAASDDPTKMHRDYERISFSEIYIRDKFETWFRNV